MPQSMPTSSGAPRPLLLSRVRGLSLMTSAPLRDRALPQLRPARLLREPALFFGQWPCEPSINTAWLVWDWHPRCCLEQLPRSAHPSPTPA